MYSSRRFQAPVKSSTILRGILSTLLIYALSCSDIGDAPLAPVDDPVVTPVRLNDRYLVQVKEMFFSPRDITIEYGDTITWALTGGVPHTVTSGVDCTYDGLFDSGNMYGGDVYTLVFDSTGVDTTGVIPYYCIPHCVLQMVGTITVLEPPVN
jgi:plastocyanin